MAGSAISAMQAAYPCLIPGHSGGTATAHVLLAVRDADDALGRLEAVRGEANFELQVR